MNSVKYYAILIYLCIFSFYSCNQKYKYFYTKNKKSFQELTEILKEHLLIGNACCIGEGCLDAKMENLMATLNFNCIRKDTIEKTFNFSNNSSCTFESIEFVYRYNSKTIGPKSYPKAGEEVERISENWFVRKIYFD